MFANFIAAYTHSLLLLPLSQDKCNKLWATPPATSTWSSNLKNVLNAKIKNNLSRFAWNVFYQSSYFFKIISY